MTVWKSMIKSLKWTRCSRNRYSVVALSDSVTGWGKISVLIGTLQIWVSFPTAHALCILNVEHGSHFSKPSPLLPREPRYNWCCPGGRRCSRPHVLSGEVTWSYRLSDGFRCLSKLSHFLLKDTLAIFWAWHKCRITARTSWIMRWFFHLLYICKTHFWWCSPPEQATYVRICSICVVHLEVSWNRGIPTIN